MGCDKNDAKSLANKEPSKNGKRKINNVQVKM